jgi:hypothetical protein
MTVVTATATGMVIVMTTTIARMTERTMMTMEAMATAVAAAFLPVAATVMLIAVLGHCLLGANSTYLRNHTDLSRSKLMWSKIYLGCPDTLIRIYSILYLDPI